MKSTAALALALGLAYGFLPGASFALGLEQKGQPQAKVSSLPTYGVEVPTRTALKTVIPSGWQLFVHQSAKLPQAVSWKVDDTWPQVLGNMAAAANLSVLVDWDARTVLIRTPDVAVQEQATRAEIEQAAVTPLPRFDTSPKAKPADAPALPQPAAVAAAPSAAAPVTYDVKTASKPAAPVTADASLAAGEEIVAPVKPLAPAAKPAIAAPVVASSAGAPVQMPKLFDPQGSASKPAPAATATPVVASAPVVSQSAVPVAPVTAAAPAVASAAAPAVPASTPLAPAEPQPSIERAVSVLSAFNSAAAPAEPAAPVVKAPLQPPAAPVVVTRAPAAPVKVVKGAQAPAAPTASERMAQTRANERTPGTVDTPAARRLAWEAAARANPGAPNPYNDVMPELPSAVFGAPQPAAVAPQAAAPAPAAVSPLPAAVAPLPPAAPVVRAAALPAPVVAMPVVRMNPTPTMVAAQEAAVAKSPVRLQSTSDFTYTAPVAMNKPPVRQVAQGIANKYGLRLVWAAPEAKLLGPVTLLANSAQEDLWLLKKALGPSSLVLDLDASAKTLRVTSKDGSYWPVAEPSAASSSASAATPVAAAPAALASVPAGAAAAPAAGPSGLVFTVEANEPLEAAMVRFARAQGYTVEWKVPGGFEAARRMTFEGTSVAQVLAKVLPPLGVSADVYTHDKHIVVRPGQSRDN